MSSEQGQPEAMRPPLSPEAVEEQRLIRRMQLMMNMVMSVIAQDSSCPWTMHRR